MRSSLSLTSWGNAPSSDHHLLKISPSLLFGQSLSKSASWEHLACLLPPLGKMRRDLGSIGMFSHLHCEGLKQLLVLVSPTGCGEGNPLHQGGSKPQKPDCDFPAQSPSPGPPRCSHPDVSLDQVPPLQSFPSVVSAFPSPNEISLCGAPRHPHPFPRTRPHRGEA